MKKMALLLLLATFGIAICQEAAPEAPAAQPQKAAERGGGRPGRPPRPDRPNRPGRGQGGEGGGRHLEQMVKRYEEVAAEIMKEFDKNQDGKLDEAEEKAFQEALEATRQKLQVYNQYNRMKVIDVDKDGKLSDEEKANAVRRQREAGLHGGQGRPNQRPPRQGQRGVQQGQGGNQPENPPAEAE
jgi:hypothetical protein